jgi:hypothetical protein
MINRVMQRLNFVEVGTLQQLQAIMMLINMDVRMRERLALNILVGQFKV